MKRIHLIIGLFLFTIFGCTSESTDPSAVTENVNTTRFEGTLFFKLISLPNLYDLPDVERDEFLAIIKNGSSAKGNAPYIEEYYAILEENDLLFKPNFKLQLDSANIINVFLEEDQYEQLKDFELSELRAEKKKVNITLAGELLDHNIVKCTEIVSVEKVDGETPTKK